MKGEGCLSERGVGMRPERAVGRNGSVVVESGFVPILEGRKLGASGVGTARRGVCRRRRRVLIASVILDRAKKDWRITQDWLGKQFGGQAVPKKRVVWRSKTARNAARSARKARESVERATIRIASSVRLATAIANQFFEAVTNRLVLSGTDSTARSQFGGGSPRRDEQGSGDVTTDDLIARKAPGRLEVFSSKASVEQPKMMDSFRWQTPEQPTTRDLSDVDVLRSLIAEQRQRYRLELRLSLSAAVEADASEKKRSVMLGTANLALSAVGSLRQTFKAFRSIAGDGTNLEGPLGTPSSSSPTSLGRRQDYAVLFSALNGWIDASKLPRPLASASPAPPGPRNAVSFPFAGAFRRLIANGAGAKDAPHSSNDAGDQEAARNGRFLSLLSHTIFRPSKERNSSSNRSGELIETQRAREDPRPAPVGVFLSSLGLFARTERQLRRQTGGSKGVAGTCNIDKNPQPRRKVKPSRFLSFGLGPHRRRSSKAGESKALKDTNATRMRPQLAFRRKLFDVFGSTLRPKRERSSHTRRSDALECRKDAGKRWQPAFGGGFWGFYFAGQPRQCRSSSSIDSKKSGGSGISVDESGKLALQGRFKSLLHTMFRHKGKNSSSIGKELGLVLEAPRQSAFGSIAKLGGSNLWSLAASFAVLDVAVMGGHGTLDIVSTAGATIGAALAISSSQNAKTLPLYFKVEGDIRPKRRIVNRNVFSKMFSLHRTDSSVSAMPNEERVNIMVNGLYDTPIECGIAPMRGAASPWSPGKHLVDADVVHLMVVGTNSSPMAKDINNGTTSSGDAPFRARNGGVSLMEAAGACGLTMPYGSNHLEVQSEATVPIEMAASADPSVIIVDAEAYAVPDNLDNGEQLSTLQATFVALDESAFHIEQILERAKSRVAMTTVHFRSTGNLELLSFFKKYYEEEGLI